MSRLVLKFGLMCWGFIGVFIAFLLVAIIIPADYLGFVSTILGLVILALFIYNLRQIYLREGFDFGWFLTVKKGYWQMLFGLLGLGLFSVGLFGLLFPNIANQLGERHWLKVAKILVILFWTALTSTFLSWELVCLAEATAYWRIGKLKEAFQAVGLGILWLIFAILFLWMFLEVINDIFFNLSAAAQSWILGIFAILSLIIGLWSGRYENPARLTKERN